MSQYKNDLKFHYGIKKGLSIIEIIIIIGIVAAISIMVFFSFSSMNENQALDKDVLMVLSVLGESRSLAMSSKDFSDYGVHLSTSSIVLFKGNSFDPDNSSNSLYYLNRLVSISNISLEGESDNIVFKKVSGETENNGTITISLSDDNSNSKTINIFSTGSFEKN